MSVEDIGNNSNRRQVAAAVSDLQDRVDTLEGSGPVELQADVEELQEQVQTADTGLLDRASALEASVDTADTGLLDRADDLETHQAAMEAELAIVAGPQTLAATFLADVLLRKVLTVAAGPNSSTVNVAHGITTPSKIVGCVIQLTNGTNHLCFSQGGMFNATAAAGISVAIDGTNVSLTSGASGDYSLYAGSIILVYKD